MNSINFCYYPPHLPLLANSLWRTFSLVLERRVKSQINRPFGGFLSSGQQQRKRSWKVKHSPTHIYCKFFSLSLPRQIELAYEISPEPSQERPVVTINILVDLIIISGPFAPFFNAARRQDRSHDLRHGIAS